MKASHATPVSVVQKTKRPLPTLPYTILKNAVLGTAFDLSLVFVGPKKIQELNNTYRNKNKPTDILSFSVGKQSGEIIIAPIIASKKAKLFKETDKQYLLRLFIHGLAHLKGFEHGGTMERYEERIKTRFVLKK